MPLPLDTLPPLAWPVLASWNSHALDSSICRLSLADPRRAAGAISSVPGQRVPLAALLLVKARARTAAIHPMPPGRAMDEQFATQGVSLRAPAGPAAARVSAGPPRVSRCRTASV